VLAFRSAVDRSTSDEGQTMAGREVDKPSDYPDTWPGVVSRLLELGSESWDKFFRVCMLVALLGVLALLGGVVWVIASTR
jgi:hypothetical protein